MVLLFEYFPLLPPVSHKPVFFAVMKMILGMITLLGQSYILGGGGGQVLTEHEIEAHYIYIHVIIFCSFGMILGMATNWSSLKTFLSQIREFVELCRS